MLNALWLSHEVVRPRLRAGGTAVDATVGNGHDTLFLATHLGPEGEVHAFDIQSCALDAACERLDAVKEPLAAVEWHCTGHEHAAAVLAAEGVSELDAAMFNLGWLPGGDKSIVTQPKTTLRALEAILPLVRPGGVVSLVVYPGHDGGAAEAEAVEAAARALAAEEWAVFAYKPLNLGDGRPFLLVLERREAAAEA